MKTLRDHFMGQINRQVVLSSRPDAIPQAENFELRDSQIPEPGDNEVLVRNQYLSIDPAMRGWVSAVANYSEPVPLNSVMRSIAIGEVVASQQAEHPVGTLLCLSLIHI